jgi:hypothetical protein
VINERPLSNLLSHEELSLESLHNNRHGCIMGYSVEPEGVAALGPLNWIGSGGTMLHGMKSQLCREEDHAAIVPEALPRM